MRTYCFSVWYGTKSSTTGSLKNVGRSCGRDVKWVYNVRRPFTGVKYLNFQAAYTLSRFVNAGTTVSGAGGNGGDQDIVNNAIDNRNPTALMGPSALDRTHQFNFGGYADVPFGFRLGIISHFWSPLSMTPTVLPSPDSGQTGATGAIFLNDFEGSGQIGNPLPRGVSSSCGTMGGNCGYNLYDVGAYMRQIGPGGLTNAINNYNATIAHGCGGGGCPTPASMRREPADAVRKQACEKNSHQQGICFATAKLLAFKCTVPLPLVPILPESSFP